MRMMEDFLKYLKGKSIHIVGVTGAEGSNILRFLIKYNLSNITAHDFLSSGSIEKSFRLWHKGIAIQEKNNLYRQFLTDLSKITLCSGKDYLKDIIFADIIFVPQSWRLYQDINIPLFKAYKNNIPFYSLTRLYLDWAPAKVIAITGTVGKGSVASILSQFLKMSGRRAYFAGNETWMRQLADKLDTMKADDILILEVSHRQLQDGFSRAPKIAIFTNLYPNHLDEVSWIEYKKLKYSLVKKQKSSDISILNFDSPLLKELGKNLQSKVLFYSEKNITVNTKNIQKIYPKIMNTNSIHFPINILAATTVADILGIEVKQIENRLPKISALPARLEKIGTFSKIDFFDDIKSTTPWATIAGLKKIGPQVILICGGRTKGIDYKLFADQIKQCTKYIILLSSQLSKSIVNYLPHNIYKITNNLKKAVELAYIRADDGDKILISPGAGFFYSDYIKGKTSLRKLITSLPPKERF